MKTLIRLLCAAFCALLLCGAAKTVSGGKVFVRADQSAAESRVDFYGNRDGFSLAGGGHRFQFSAQKRQAVIDGKKVSISFPPLFRNGAWFLSSADWNGVVHPLLFPSTGAVSHRIGRIILDPGHGGNDCGASGSFSNEKTLTLALSFRVAEILRRCGYDVRLTRYSDRQVPLNERVRNLSRRGADLFVSIHVNSAADPRIAGIESFCLTQAGAPSSNQGRPSDSRYPGNRLDGNNFLLAYHLQNAMLRRTKAEDRGVKRGRFVVLRDAQVPAALVEIGFISNRNEERKLNDAAYREQLARGIATGIISYHHTVRR